MPAYNMIENSPQHLFGNLRTKIQVFGGGYGNGKTAAAIVQKVLRIAKDYPGANILVARATYPKLNDTIRKEFLKWCPVRSIKSFPRSKNSDNTCTMMNGTTINFRYIAQQGKGASEGEQTTSNLLSATYDLIVVDQMEDPEIVEKDFDDLLGRLRGNANYIGDDSTMPVTGPRWFVICVNPTRNWVYRRIIKPLKDYVERNIITDLLLCSRHPSEINDQPNPDADKPILGKDGKPELLISLVEGSTYTNKHNLGADFIQTLESVYRGQAKDRYLMGRWASYEGLVHPEYDATVHQISRNEMTLHFNSVITEGFVPSFFQAYDFGMVAPSCYLLAFTDQDKNIFVYDGFYMPMEMMDLEDQQKFIHEAQEVFGITGSSVYGDPAIFKKTQVTKNENIKTIAKMFSEGDHPIKMKSADNNIERGLTKVNKYLAIKGTHRHPITQTLEAPHIYFAQELEFIDTEISGYFWKTDKSGVRIDEPVDKNDHAMNTLKYLVSKAPEITRQKIVLPDNRHLTNWSVRARGN